jgi:Domain of unknown function (DUF6883)
LTPRAEEAVNVREKLLGYSLNAAHKDGGPKARAFERILGITTADIEYLEAAIFAGIAEVPIGSVRHNPETDAPPRLKLIAKHSR